MFSNLRQQIKILKSRGIIINDNIKNRQRLIDYNYYNVINGFKEPFLDKNSREEKYKEGTTFDEIYNLFQFDRKLRSLILEYLLIIESSLKTKIAYEFSKKYGEDNYLSSTSFCFDTHSEKKNTIALLYTIINKISKSKNTDIYNHFIKTNREIPIWAVINFFDFGTIRVFYDNLDKKLQFNISKYYKLSPKMLISFLSIINMYRNVCAHDNRIMKYIILNPDLGIVDTEIHKNLNLEKRDMRYICGKRDLFALFITFRYLLNDNDFANFYNKLINLFNELERSINTISIEDIYEEYMLPKKDTLIGQFSWKEIINVKK